MVMRYLSTLTQEESLRIHQQVEFEEEDEHSPRLAKFDIIQIAPRPNMSPAQMVPINLSFDEKGWRISNKYF